MGQATIGETGQRDLLRIWGIRFTSKDGSVKMQRVCVWQCVSKCVMIIVLIRV